jgi:hypothetical protein
MLSMWIIKFTTLPYDDTRMPYTEVIFQLKNTRPISTMNLLVLFCFVAKVVYANSGSTSGVQVGDDFVPADGSPAAWAVLREAEAQAVISPVETPERLFKRDSYNCDGSTRCIEINPYNCQGAWERYTNTAVVSQKMYTLYICDCDF